MSSNNIQKTPTPESLAESSTRALDKSKVPTELAVHQNPIDVKTILAMGTHDIIDFKYGDFVPGAHAFNCFLEANVQPGVVKSMTKQRVVQLIKQLAMSLNSGGLSSLPMVCLDTECPRYADCSLRLAGEALPVGFQCPLEKMEALNHVRNLAQDFGEGRSYADQLMIQGVAGVQMLKSRVYADLAMTPEPIIEVEKGVDARGNVVKDKIENPNFKILQNLLKQEQTLLKGLHLTQEQRLKLDVKKAKTADQLVGSLKERLQELVRKNKTAGLDIIDVDATIPQTPNENNINEVRSGFESERTSGDAETGSMSGDTTGDISESIGNLQTTQRDYRAVTQGRTGPNNKSYIGKSPFGGGSTQNKDSNAGSDAGAMEEVF